LVGVFSGYKFKTVYGTWLTRVEGRK